MIRGVPAFPGEGPAVLAVDANGVMYWVPVPQVTSGEYLALTDLEGALQFMIITGAVYEAPGLPYEEWLIRIGLEDLFTTFQGLPWSDLDLDTVTDIIRAAQFT